MNLKSPVLLSGVVKGKRKEKRERSVMLSRTPSLAGVTPVNTSSDKGNTVYVVAIRNHFQGLLNGKALSTLSPMIGGTPV